MIELLILFELRKKVLTMYGISKEIKSDFSVLTLPSYGTIKPALVRLANAGFIKMQKTISSGGRPSTYYSLTTSGEEELKNLLLLNPLDNPIQFLPVARMKIFCADILNSSEQKKMYKMLKTKAESILLDVSSRLTSNELGFHSKMVFDNLLCEYKNFISLLEGLERAC